jgi:hypothetical protein
MSKNKTNRREFLGIAGASLIGIIAAASGAASITARQLPAAEQTSLEMWLLKTGAADLSGDTFQGVMKQIESSKR